LPRAGGLSIAAARRRLHGFLTSPHFLLSPAGLRHSLLAISLAIQTDFIAPDRATVTYRISAFYPRIAFDMSH
jgi:hypothetical protein